MNLFNLFVSAFVMSSGIDNAWIIIFLGVFPFVFSLLFFLIPLVRLLIVRYLNKKREKNIIRKKLFRAIVKLNKNATEKEILAAASIPSNEFDLAKSILNEMVIDYRGEIDISEIGEPIYKFDKLLCDIKLVM